MALRKITADYIFSNVASVAKGKVLIFDEDDRIVAIENMDQHDHTSVEILTGALVPGYVNAHCHLELSHLLGAIPTGIGLLSFIQDVVTRRNVDQMVILDAISEADQHMFENGIMAVGDICNTPDTFAQKAESKIKYYSFVEMFDFMNHTMTDDVFLKYKSVYDRLPDSAKDRKSAVPHAPYSVSEKLFKKINLLNDSKRTVSVHNSETQSEVDLFLSGDGGFPTLFETLGIKMDCLTSLGKSPMQYLFANLDPQQRTLFVHNTLVTHHDLEMSNLWNKEIFWATCPNANLYIENRLPNYQLFLEKEAKVCIGTDSLSSNWQLSIFEEMRTIARYQSFVSTEDLIRWSSLYGAQALGFEDSLGSLEVGKKPGLNLITLNVNGLIDDQSTSRKVV